jgi:hypothetical protein
VLLLVLRPHRAASGYSKFNRLRTSGGMTVLHRSGSGTRRALRWSPLRCARHPWPWLGVSEAGWEVSRPPGRSHALPRSPCPQTLSVHSAIMGRSELLSGLQPCRNFRRGEPEQRSSGVGSSEISGIGSLRPGEHLSAEQHRVHGIPERCPRFSLQSSKACPQPTRRILGRHRAMLPRPTRLQRCSDQ